MSGKRPTLGKGLGDLGLSELLGDLDAPAVSVSSQPIVTAVPEIPPQNVTPTIAPEVIAAPAKKAAVATASSERPAPVAAPESNSANAALKVLPVDLLKPGRYQPRKVF